MNADHESLESAPFHLNPRPKFPFGRFSGSVQNEELKHWETRSLKRRLHRKAWVFGGVYSPEAFVGFAVVDAGYAATAFTYYLDRRSKSPTFLEEKTVKPFYFPKNFEASLSQDWLLKTGRLHWEIASEKDAWNFNFRSPKLNLDFALKQSFPGLSAIAPAHRRPFHYTYKLASVPAEVSVKVLNAKEHSWSGALGVLDFSAGFPPRRTYWNWGSFVGETEDGHSVGINVVDPFNDGLENALWIDKKLFPLSKVQFFYNKKSTKDPWVLKSSDLSLEIYFYPEHEHTKNKNLFFLKSKFKQGMGHFLGFWKDRNGKKHHFKGNGVVEEHAALW